MRKYHLGAEPVEFVHEATYHEPLSTVHYKRGHTTRGIRCNVWGKCGVEELYVDHLYHKRPTMLEI